MTLFEPKTAPTSAGNGLFRSASAQRAKARPARLRRSTAGLTLLEILIVIVLIAILVAVAVPMLTKSRIASNEVSAISTLKTIYAAQAMYYVSNNAYASLQDLASGKYVDPSVGSGTKAGYNHIILVDPPIQWHAEAIPAQYKDTGIRSFYVDEAGVINGKDMGEAPAAYKSRDDCKNWPTVE
jgi:prepilin-type N-terminal cleavage/methylation domain-containing protein